ncbi:MAG: SRPBCC domain-containing protein [Candidatus Doudnabacteria bacterium]|nr:SRPBCC domain-containing protein [Candidatus Doudnabacteria bacterium]
MDNFSENAKGLVAKVELTIKATPEKVWEALTKPEIVKQYLFGTNLVTDWTIGGPIVYRGEWEGKTYEDKGTVLEFIPNKKMVSTYWSSMGGLPDSPENYNTITTELTEIEGGTKVTLLQDNNATEEKRDHSQKNWTMVMEKMKEILEK